MAFTLGEIAEHIGCEIKGDPDLVIERVCTLQSGIKGGITFLSNRKYSQYLQSTQASAVILAEKDVEQCPVSALIHANPYVCYARVAHYISAQEKTSEGVHPTAVVHPEASISSTASIAANVVIEANVCIEDDVVIGAQCTIGKGSMIKQGSRLNTNISVYNDTQIGKRAIIHSGVVIGADGFGIAQDDGQWVKVPQLGRVSIGDDVEIGANTTIDRGAIEDTVIGNGVKLDNQIQIGHNVVIGDHTAMAGCSGVAGSTVIGQRCTIGAAAVVLGHLELVDDVHVTACTMVSKSITEAGVYSSGTPMQANSKWKRNYTRFAQLDELAKRVRELESKA